MISFENMFYVTVIINTNGNVKYFMCEVYFIYFMCEVLYVDCFVNGIKGLFSFHFPRIWLTLNFNFLP